MNTKFLYTVYKTTNTLNGMFYIGVHKTNNPNDDYLGSGKYLKHAIKKYGREHFYKTVLFIFDNPQDMYNKELELVNETVINDTMSYNLCVGGKGGFDFINRSLSSEQLSARGRYARKFSSGTSNATRTPEWNENISKSKVGKPNGWLGRTHTEESKERMKKTRPDLSGSSNGMFNKIWLNDGENNILILKQDITNYDMDIYILGKIKTYTRKDICKCGNSKDSASNQCIKCSSTKRCKFSDSEIIDAWNECNSIVEVATKLGYKNPNNIGASIHRLKKLKPK